MQLVLDEMNIYKEDLSQAYSHLCEDELGEVKYTQLVDQLQHLKHHDSHTMLLIIRHCLKDLQDEIQLHVENKLVEHLEKTDRMMDMLTEMHAQRNWIFPSELNKVSAAEYNKSYAETSTIRAVEAISTALDKHGSAWEGMCPDWSCEQHNLPRDASEVRLQGRMKGHLKGHVKGSSCIADCMSHIVI